MRKCLLCERQFEQIEIDQGIPIQHSRRNTILLTRFQSGMLHQFSVEKRQPKPLFPGAIVVPKPVEAPPEEVAPIVAAPEAPAEQTQDVEAMAQVLTEHFQNPEPYNAEPEPETEQTSFHDQHATGDVGSRQEGIVVAYYPSPRESGFIRLLRYGRNKSGLFFHVSDVVKGEFIGMGVKVSCLVSDPMPGRQALTARQIEVLELESEESRKNSTKGSETKIYKHDTEE